MSESQIIVYRSQAAIEQRRKMAQVPAVVNALDNTEKLAFLASTNKMVTEYPDAVLVAELSKALRSVFRDVGYRADDREDEICALRLALVLRRYYGQLTIQEFRLAFEMSVVGELDEFLPRRADGGADRGHYQQFSVEYVCKILNAYRAKRDRILRKVEKAIPKKAVEQDEIEEAKEATKRDLVAAYQYFKENGRLPALSPIAEMLYYNLLVEAGLAPKVEVTQEEQDAVLRKAIDGFLARGYTGDAMDLKAQGREAPSIQYDAFALARRKNLRNTFARMTAEGVNIHEYIN